MTRFTFPEQPLPLELPPRGPLPSRRRRGGFWRACGCLGLIFFLLLPLIIGLADVAKTGIVSIPVFSPIFYAPPQPSRVVTVDQDAMEGIRNGVAVNLVEGIARLTLTEADLTYLVRQLVSSGSDPLFSPTGQAVITPGGIELSGLLLRPVRANLAIILVPAVADGTLDFNLKTVTLGALSLPPSFAEMLVGKTLRASLTPVSTGLQPLGTLEAVTLKEGTIVIEGSLKADTKE